MIFDMKRLFLAFFFIFPITISAQTSISESFYKHDLEKCDQNFKQNVNKNSSGSGMILAADSQVVCYESVAHKIIDKYYSKQSESMKNNLRGLITAYKQTSDDMYNPDVCYNDCGNLSALMAYTPTLDFINNYISHLISAINTKF